MLAKSSIRRIARSASRALSALLLVVILTGAFPQQSQAASSSSVKEARVQCALYHQIQKGETWEKVARLYGVSVTELKDANPWQRFKEGHFLCIPSINVIVKDPDIYFEAVVYMHRWVYVHATGLPKNQRYRVNIRARKSDYFTHLGYVRSNDKGVIEKHFRIPAYLQHAWVYQVCLKNVDYGYLICDTAHHWRD
ncbi:MAG: LysM peptidoglycan-binding domain-containing protein [Anaerolineales bacterium]|nr:LysM peptidoglycan-binding domain-containing protein [Anaerolineales bacterium]